MGGVDNEVSLSERDLRALAMELAIQLPRNARDAQFVLRMMRIGYDHFLSEQPAQDRREPNVVSPQFRRS